MKRGIRPSKPCSSWSSFNQKLLLTTSAFIKSNNTYKNSGFSLLELVTALAVVSILATVSLVGIDGKGGILAWVTRGEVDEAKALLNSAAADCLQKNRINDANNKDAIDSEILSDKKLNTIGYKIDPSANKCSYLQLLPSNEDDDLRYPIGFSVADGKLTKFANPSSDDKASIRSCENWAGINCKQDESLKELVKWKEFIAAEKSTCEKNYSTWLKNGTNPYIFIRWNPNADSGCPSKPPQGGSTAYKTSNTCTPVGCNRVVYGLDGEFVGITPEDYKKALEAKYGKQCTEWAAQKAAEKYTNNPIDQPATKSPECGEQEFWFFEGEDQGSKEGLQAAQDKKLSDQCVADREAARKNGHVGQWGPVAGPGECGTKTFICDKTFVDAETYYKTCGLKPPAQCKLSLAYYDQACTDYELNPYIFKKCGERPKDPPPINCKYVGMGKPGGIGWDKTPQCGQWARCAGLY